jgi:tripartite-type tricarboxylate transporter receptor subunit TctC
MKKINYDPVKDFAPITRVGTIPFVLVVNPSVPAKSIRELLDLAKPQPGKLTFGSGSAGSLLPGFMLQQMGGVTLTHVPYKSIPPALTDTISGQITMAFADLVTGTPQIKAGKVRALGVTSLKRAALLPDVPAIAETLKGFELIAWFALFSPTGTPPDILTRLHAESVKILARPEVRDRYSTLGIEVSTTTPAELAAYVKSEMAKWAKLAKAAGIEPE